MAIVFLKCSARSCCWLCFWASSFWISTKDLATVISNPFSSSFMSSTALWCSSRDFLTTKTMIVLCAFVQHSTITVMSWSNTSKFSSFPVMALFYVLTDWVNGGIQSWYWTDGGLMLLYSFFFVFCANDSVCALLQHTQNYLATSIMTFFSLSSSSAPLEVSGTSFPGLNEYGKMPYL